MEQKHETEIDTEAFSVSLIQLLYQHATERNVDDKDICVRSKFILILSLWRGRVSRQSKRENSRLFSESWKSNLWKALVVGNLLQTFAKQTHAHTLIQRNKLRKVI